MRHPLYGGHNIILYGYDHESSQVKIYDPQNRDSIHSFVNLRDGRVLNGYIYSRTAYYD